MFYFELKESKHRLEEIKGCLMMYQIVYRRSTIPGHWFLFVFYLPQTAGNPHKTGYATYRQPFYCLFYI